MDLGQRILSDIDAAVVRTNPSSHRRHLGASLIGDECWLKLWFSFRWVKLERFSGRQLRLFQRGHEEEVRFVRFLRAAGWGVDDVDPETGQQYKISACGGHFGGSLDGIGTPPKHYDLPPHVLLEFKTSNKNRMGNLIKNKVKLAHARHWAQMCVYGLKKNLSTALYMAVNKDNDDIHCEPVELDWAHGEAQLDKAQRIIQAPVGPPRVSDDSTFFQCKWCAFRRICHKGVADPEPIEKNCRSCRWAAPGENKAWFCKYFGIEIPRDKIGDEHPCWESVEWD